jgi:hypothetical protein
MNGMRGIMYVAALGTLLVVAAMYFLTQYVVASPEDADRAADPPNGTSPAADDTATHHGGAILISPNSDSGPIVYFS